MHKLEQINQEYANIVLDLLYNDKYEVVEVAESQGWSGDSLRITIGMDAKYHFYLEGGRLSTYSFGERVSKIIEKNINDSCNEFFKKRLLEKAEEFETLSEDEKYDLEEKYEY